MKKRNIVRIVSMALAVSMIAAMTAGCGQSSDSKAGTGNEGEAAAGGEASYKDTITIAHWEEPTTLDPQAQGKMSCGAVSTQIYDTLVTLDENGQPLPCLAESWEQIDDTTFRFYLREGVKFHNGDTLTAEDVRYTIERACTNPGSSSTFITFDPENTKAIDDLTVENKLKSPVAAI